MLWLFSSSQIARSKSSNELNLSPDRGPHPDRRRVGLDAGPPPNGLTDRGPHPDRRREGMDAGTPPDGQTDPVPHLGSQTDSCTHNPVSYNEYYALFIEVIKINLAAFPSEVATQDEAEG